MQYQFKINAVDGIVTQSEPSTGFNSMNIVKDGWIIMQYTGLKDRNGKEIYEGDLMKYLVHYPHDFQERNPLKKHGRIAGGVQWVKGWLYLDYVDEKKDGSLLYEEEAKNWEVVGNIYENPDMLQPEAEALPPKLI